MKNNKTNIEIKPASPDLIMMTTIIFVSLKLFGWINWSWWWVLSPLWLPTVIALSLFIFLISLALIINLFK